MGDKELFTEASRGLQRRYFVMDHVRPQWERPIDVDNLIYDQILSHFFQQAEAQQGNLWGHRLRVHGL